MAFIQAVPVKQFCYSVCHYGNSLYVAHLNGVSVIKDGNNHSSDFLNFEGHCKCIRIHKRHIYLLVLAVEQGKRAKLNRWYFRKYSMKGKYVTEWLFSSVVRTLSANQFVIDEDTIFAVSPGSTDRNIRRYTLDGNNLHADIPVKEPVDAQSNVCMCVTPQRQLVLCQTEPSLVICYNLDKEEEIWRLTNLVRPMSVTSDNDDHVVVFTNRGRNKVCFDVIIADTGNSQAYSANAFPENFILLSQIYQIC